MHLQTAFKLVLSRVPAPVVVVTLATGGVKRGVTCSSFTHVSLTPPLISFSLNYPSRFHDMLKSSELFAVHILSKHQVLQSIHFSTAAIEDRCQFDSIPHEEGSNGVPLLKDTSSILMCTPYESHHVGDHHVWYGKVAEVVDGIDSFSSPLLYYSKTYRSIGDDLFVTAFEEASLPFKEWTHQAHIRMAWIYISEYGRVKATEFIKNGIKRFNEVNKSYIGKSGFRGYHETVTEFYIHMVAHALQECSLKNCLFQDFIKDQKHLLDTKLIFEYYTDKVIFSEEARNSYVSPDRKPLPVLKISLVM